ncbi:type IV pilus twitching motility protein PilT [Megalodesulfovibrio paquesii]
MSHCQHTQAIPTLEDLLQATLDLEASDLHLSAGHPPAVRVHGRIEVLDLPDLTHAHLEGILLPMLAPRQRESLAEARSVDLAHFLGDQARFRVNIFYQRGKLAAVMRRLPSLVVSVEGLGLPPAVLGFTELKDGLVLVTGPTGSGKTTTLATLIDAINRHHADHIITIEDPIEFVHPNKRSRVTQRELHVDVPGFGEALRDALREDPDVILVGEMRDLDTMRTAIMAAETGHLVFSTLHSRDAVSSVTRMISVFPFQEQSQIRTQLAGVLKGVISQRLLRSSKGGARHAAVEVMRTTPGIANLIRAGKEEQLYSLIETGGNEGMQTMEQSLAKLFLDGNIDRDTAVRMAKSESLIVPRINRGQAAQAAQLAQAAQATPGY